MSDPLDRKSVLAITIAILLIALAIASSLAFYFNQQIQQSQQNSTTNQPVVGCVAISASAFYGGCNLIILQYTNSNYTSPLNTSYNYTSPETTNNVYINNTRLNITRVFWDNETENVTTTILLQTLYNLDANTPYLCYTIGSELFNHTAPQLTYNIKPDLPDNFYFYAIVKPDPPYQFSYESFKTNQSITISYYPINYTLTYVTVQYFNTTHYAYSTFYFDTMQWTYVEYEARPLIR